jgi:predicted RNA-binding Zn-ribbon protein involved in translation (DUF1610 family)
MAQANPLRCPQCGIAMNFHAEKLDSLTGLSEPDAVDPDLGGVVEEIHTCPGCGQVETRRAALEEGRPG